MRGSVDKRLPLANVRFGSKSVAATLGGELPLGSIYIFWVLLIPKTINATTNAATAPTSERLSLSSA
jgi:hypothetical protein